MEKGWKLSWKKFSRSQKASSPGSQEGSVVWNGSSLWYSCLGKHCGLFPLGKFLPALKYQVETDISHLKLTTLLVSLENKASVANSKLYSKLHIWNTSGIQGFFGFLFLFFFYIGFKWVYDTIKKLFFPPPMPGPDSITFKSVSAIKIWSHIQKF